MASVLGSHIAHVYRCPLFLPTVRLTGSHEPSILSTITLIALALVSTHVPISYSSFPMSPSLASSMMMIAGSFDHASVYRKCMQNPGSYRLLQNISSPLHFKTYLLLVVNVQQVQTNYLLRQHTDKKSNIKGT